jgi:o-succinylbenzoate---CoA ligase
MERSELIEILRATGCAEERDRFVFLRDPHRDEPAPAAIQSAIGDPQSAMRQGWLCLATGGSSGGTKFARHDEHTLLAAVRGFCGHFGLERVNAINVLPAHHVSGLMPRLRCAATAGRHVAWGWKNLEAGDLPAIAGDDWVISLVPTQLERLLGAPVVLEWLRRFRIIFLSGGPTWPQLADDAAAAGLRVSLSYGMTETAAMVAAQQPEEFLAGDRSCGRAMPHARINLTSDGVIRVAGDSVFRGYWPEWSDARDFVTQDLGRIDARGRLHVLGRADAVIITGGEKVQPAEVEAALRASGEFSDVAVIGVPDPKWGERVVACYPASAREPDLGRATAALANHQRPKKFVAIAAADWPRNAQGKIDRAALLAAVSEKRN